MLIIFHIYKLNLETYQINSYICTLQSIKMLKPGITS